MLTQFSRTELLLGKEAMEHPGSDGINGVNLANASQLSAWTNRTVSNPVDPEEYAAELNKRIEAEGKFPVRE